MNLPTLLSGPIIRFTNTKQVCIWLATSQNFEIDANLYYFNSEPVLTTQLLETKTQVETIHTGKNLYIHLITIYPKVNPLPTDQLLGYNLYLSNKFETLDLKSFGLLDQQNPHAIVYEDLPLPSFYINTDSKNKILYGSCRKPHSNGEDALASADIATEEHCMDVSERPSSLFLMGDQIYADDIPDPLSQFIFQLGEQLIGEKEELAGLDHRLAMEPFQTSIELIHGRQFIINHFAKFTSNHAANHLIQFGEYAAMYLLTYSPQLWELAKDCGVFDPFEQVHANGDIYFTYPNNNCYKSEYKKELEQHRARYTEQLYNLYTFHQNLYRGRRLLANTPTYMIFDDHDITDDWNLTIDWKNNVWNSSLGRHIVSNGLAAYWTFQGWGNNPWTFTNEFKTKIENYFQNLSIQGKAYEEYVNLLWQFDRWHFIAPTNPRAIFLDTRTMRGYDPQPQPTKVGALIEENIRSPQLINNSGWKKLSQTLSRSSWQSNEKLIIVSPTPLYGIGLIESVLHEYVYPLRVLGISVQSMLDFEAWKYNDEGFKSFIEWLAKWEPSHCFILSGDVHYASSVRSTIEFVNETQLEILQFTSSPMCNMSFTGMWGFLMKKVVWLNALKRKRENIYRHCDDGGQVVLDEEDACPNDYKWREQIQYLSTEKGNIIDIDNNIGLLEIQSDTVQNKLLKYYGTGKLENHFKQITLSDS
ncbi:metallophosphoesterase family protein [Aquibacillus rhizosphaerae]|uniref:PhoD-like phosphatase metallophosphatase domain-containing protein n=1 Tax=Aquibacillus rhizosphaerae TaxID=3051431 RepID=A0ABT7L586_9BACI|nr:hypothetical protein [Aquibacillus sp. LR5S19]MDL4841032.1 hypothetical protein [Aquibacillus sp. LR5S19]